MRKSILKRISVLTLSGIIALSTFSGCGEKVEMPKNLLPEYTSGRTEFHTFAYGSPRKGVFVIDGKEVLTIEDANGVERMKEYKDAGFDTAYITADGFGSEFYEGTDGKYAMDTAVEAGIEKVIVTDYRLLDVIARNDFKMIGHGSEYFINLDDQSKGYDIPEYVGDNRTLEERALDMYVWDCMKNYSQHEGFFGLNMRDEPSIDYAENYGKLYKSIRRLEKIKDLGHVYIQCNLLPLGVSSTLYAKNPMTIDLNGAASKLEAAYRSYVRDYVEFTGADRLCVDIYAFREAGIFNGFFQTMQMFKEVCAEYGVETTYVAQSFDYLPDTDNGYAHVNKSEMMFEANVALGMGYSNYSYYYYFVAKEYSHAPGAQRSAQNGSFINMKGERTEIYYYGQEILTWMRKFSNVILNYDYLGAKMFQTKDLPNVNVTPYNMSNRDQATGEPAYWNNSHEFTKVKDVTFNNDILFMTELKDSENDLYMYMVQNVIDPRDGDALSTEVTFEIDFGSEYTWVAEYDCGRLTYKKLEDGVYKGALSAGYAYYLIPIVE